MKNRVLLLMLALLLCATALPAAAEQGIEIPSVLQRGKVPAGAPDNPVIPGISSLTGLPISDQKYVPILSQVDNNLGALPQWGLVDASIMYELPVSGSGWTRLTALYADKYPEEAGPVRSARLMHADLREQWDALLIHYGEQTTQGSNFRQAIRDYGVPAKGLEMDGVGNKYKDFFLRTRYHVSPHNITTYLQKAYALMVQNGYEFKERPFLFTDEKNYEGPDAIKIQLVHKNNRDTASTFVYEKNTGVYLRYTAKGLYSDLFFPQETLTYSNFIVQRTRLTFNKSSRNPLLPDVVGGGAADIFIGGKYIAGTWSRSTPQSRTIFYDQNGQEIRLQRGRTWIAITNEDSQLTYDSSFDADTQAYINATGSLPRHRPLQEGDSGEEVRRLKQALFEKGYFSSNKFNNRYQDSTTAAVSKFEADNGLPVDGIADSLVLDLLFGVEAPIAVPERAPIDSSFTVGAEDTGLYDNVTADAEDGEFADLGEETPIQTEETEAAEMPSAEETTVAEESPADTAASAGEETLPPADAADAEVLTALVTTRNKGELNLREEADKASKLVARIPYQATVEVMEQGTEWSKVRYQDFEGYVMNTYLTIQALVGEEGAQGAGGLTVGDSGPEVVKMKTRFYQLGYFKNNVFNDVFQENTADTVRRFEKRNGLPVDGIADDEMLTLLYSKEAKRP